MSEIISVPAVGLGTFLINDENELNNALEVALNNGYKLIDTASIYNNEHIIGSFLKDNNIDRKELFLTTKIYNDVKTYEQTIEAFELSLKRLKTDYIDLILIHWPQGKKRNAEVYKALEYLLKENKVRAIGVSNFLINHLDDLLETAEVVPMMNQVESHPYLQQQELQNYCDENEISLTSYGPFAKGDVFNNDILKDIASKHKVTVAQVVVKWGNQRGIFMIPKSITKERIINNIDVKGFTLTDKEMKDIASLNTGTRYYTSPDNVNII